MLYRVRAATRPGGLVAIGIVADRVEVDEQGRQRPALLESPMSAAEATALLTGAFTDFDVTYQRLGPAQVRENRGEDTYGSTRRSSPGSRRNPSSAVQTSRSNQVQLTHASQYRHPQLSLTAAEYGSQSHL